MEFVRLQQPAEIEPQQAEGVAAGLQDGVALRRRYRPRLDAGDRRPERRPLDGPDLEARDMLDRPDETIDGTAVLWDQDHTLATYAAAELLAQRFSRLVLVTPRERLASDVGLVTRQGIYRRLYGMPNVEVVLLSDIHADSALDEGHVNCRNVLNDSLVEVRDVALLTWSGSRAPNDELAAPLRAEGLEVICVGDCDMPRTLLAATSDGHALGRSL